VRGAPLASLEDAASRSDPTETMASTTVAAIVPIGEGEQAFIAHVAEQVRAQRVELVLVDQTFDGELASRAAELGASIVREAACASVRRAKP